MPRVDLLLTGFTFNSDQGRFGFSTVALVRGRRTLLVDTGPHGRRALLVEALRACGLTPADVAGVVLTHAHWDHTQNLDLFPHATFYIHPREVEYARNPKPGDWATARYFPRLLQDLRVEEVEEGDELDEGVRVLETPGHTRGHISLLVETEEGTVALSGDALAEAGAVARGKPYLIFWDEREAEESVRRLLHAARVFYPGHDRPFRILEDGAIAYIGGAEGIRLQGGLGRGHVSVWVAPAPPPEVWVLRDEPEREG